VVDEFGLLRMDPTGSLVLQQRRMRDLVRPHLEGVLRPNGSGLLGRYLGEGGRRPELRP
jgi:hypothetical protein